MKANSCAQSKLILEHKKIKAARNVWELLWFLGNQLIVNIIILILKVFYILPKQWIVDYILEMEIIVWHFSVLWRAAYRRQYFGNTILVVVDFYKYSLLIFRQCFFYGVASFCFFDFYFGNIIVTLYIWRYYGKDGQRSDF